MTKRGTAIEVLSAGDIAAVSDLGQLLREMEAAFAGGQRAGADVPLRVLIARERPFTAFGAMPAVSQAHDLFVTKVAAFVEGAESSVHAVVTAFACRTGRPLAVLDGAALTNLKCAAVTGLVTDACAAQGAAVLAVIGSGVQAREQVRGVRAVRDVDEIRLFSRDPRRMARFADELRTTGGDVRVVEAASAATAVAGADIISTATTSARPLFAMSAWPDHLHVNCVGAHTRESREVPRELFERSIVIVEDLPTAIAEAGEVHAQAVDIEQLVREPRSRLRAVPTLFSSTGHAFLDLVTAAHVLRAARIHPGVD